MYLEERIENDKVKKLAKDMAFMEETLGIAKNYVSDKLEKYKRSKEYKKNRRIEAMKALEDFRKKQLEIEEEKKYIKKIKRLIDFEEKEYQKEQKLKSTYKRNSRNNVDSEGNNSLFILNRYQNTKYNNKINASNTLEKNRSSINIHSSLYKESTNSTTNNNIETKQSIFNNNMQTRIKKRYSINSNLDFSSYTLNATNKIQDNIEYININDSSNNENPLNYFETIKKLSNNDSSTKFPSKSKSKNNISTIKFDKNYVISTISDNDYNKTNDNLTSDYANISTQKRRKTNKFPIRNIKSTINVTQFTDKVKKRYNEKNNSTTMNQSLNDKNNEDLKWDLFKDFNKLNRYIYIRNNHEFKTFCDNSTGIPRDVTNKINKSFELDEELKNARINYVKLLMDQKIKKYYDKELMS